MLDRLITNVPQIGKCYVADAPMYVILDFLRASDAEIAECLTDEGDADMSPAQFRDRLEIEVLRRELGL